MKYICALILLTLAGCALEPNAIRFEGEHVSHLTQHFGADPTSYGFDALNIEAHYQLKHAFLDISEGYVLNARDLKTNGPCYGGLWGPREVFTLRAGYEIPLKP